MEARIQLGRDRSRNDERERQRQRRRQGSILGAGRSELGPWRLGEQHRRSSPNERGDRQESAHPDPNGHSDPYADSHPDGNQNSVTQSNRNLDAIADTNLDGNGRAYVYRHADRNRDAGTNVDGHSDRDEHVDPGGGLTVSPALVRCRTRAGYGLATTSRKMPSNRRSSRSIRRPLARARSTVSRARWHPTSLS
jgi:hypothetical protein